jgi:hypothetical protein
MDIGPEPGIVCEKSFLSYYKNEFLRTARGCQMGVEQQTGNGMSDRAHQWRESGCWMEWITPDAKPVRGCA